MGFSAQSRTRFSSAFGRGRWLRSAAFPALALVVVSLFATPQVASARSSSPVVIGFCGGDDWEPEIAADSTSHVYVIFAHFEGDPTCSKASATGRNIYVRVSDDGGDSFGRLIRLPRLHYPKVVDCVITVDPVTGTVYASFLAYGKPTMKAAQTDVVVARSTDFGASWTATKVNGPGCTECDHPWTVAYDNNVYVAYAQGPDHFLARSSNGGRTWTETNVLHDTHVAFPEGGVYDAHGNAWFAWGDCFGSCSGKHAAIYQVSRTKAGTPRTVFAHVAGAPSGPSCPPSVSCGFAYWGPQDDIAIDGAGNLYLVWQGTRTGHPKDPPIVKLSSCRADSDCTRASSWHTVGRADDKAATGCAGGQCYALYPRIEGGDTAGEIAVMWMDDRLGDPLDHTNGWNVWLRTSTTGGTTWSGASRRVSAYDPDRSESRPNGFLFPYGDYEGIDITPDDRAVMTWGEGHNYTGGPSEPGHVMYASLPV